MVHIKEENTCFVGSAISPISRLLPSMADPPPPRQTPPGQTPPWENPSGQTPPGIHPPCPVHAGIHSPLPIVFWDTHPLPSACWDTCSLPRQPLLRMVRILLECILCFQYCPGQEILLSSIVVDLLDEVITLMVCYIMR